MARGKPVQEGVRVILLSTGSEESFMEGMQAFGRRHFPELARERGAYTAAAVSEIARRLHLSGGTVRNYLSEAIGKLVLFLVLFLGWLLPGVAVVGAVAGALRAADVRMQDRHHLAQVAHVGGAGGDAGDDGRA